jgi:hypothetical protein
LLEETLQSAYDSGYYSGTDNADAHERAMKRRNACFAELKRRLERVEQLADAVTDVPPIWRNDPVHLLRNWAEHLLANHEVQAAEWVSGVADAIIFFKEATE